MKCKRSRVTDICVNHHEGLCSYVKRGGVAAKGAAACEVDECGETVIAVSTIALCRTCRHPFCATRKANDRTIRFVNWCSRCLLIQELAAAAAEAELQGPAAARRAEAAIRKDMSSEELESAKEMTFAGAAEIRNQLANRTRKSSESMAAVRVVWARNTFYSGRKADTNIVDGC